MAGERGVSMTTDNPDRRRIIAFTSQGTAALALVAETLGQAGVNIEAIDGEMAGEFGVIVLHSNDDDAALRALLRAGVRAITSEAVVFRLPDQPGALAGVARRFQDANLNVRTIHVMHRQAGHAIVAVTTDDDERARELLDDDALL